MAGGRSPTVYWTDDNGVEHDIQEKQKRCVDIYLANGYNIKQAYLEVYGDADVAHASRFLRRPKVDEYLKAERKRLFDALNVDKMRVIEKLAEIAFSKKGDEYYNAPAQLRALDMLAKCNKLYDGEYEKRSNSITISLKDS